jgi:Flp pilus assembly protein TadB
LCFCLFVFVLFLVYPMLTVSLCCVFVCLSLSCVWCTQCWQYLCGTPDTGQRQTNKNTTQRYCQHWVHQKQDKDKQTKNTTQRYCQHWVHQTQDKNKQKSVLFFFVFILCLVYPMLTVSLYCVLFCLCPVSGVPNVDKQTKNTTHRYCQHWVHQTQDKDKQTKTQYRDTVNIGCVPNVDSISVLFFFVFILCLVYPMLTVSLQTQDRDKQTKTQYRDTVNIGYTRHRTKTNKQKTQHRDTVNIGYTRHRTETNFVSVLCLVYPMLTVSLCCVFFLFIFVLCLVYPMLTVSLCCVLCLFIFVLCLVKTNKQKYNTEILSTLGTPDTGQRQTNKKTQ